MRLVLAALVIALFSSTALADDLPISAAAGCDENCASRYEDAIEWTASTTPADAQCSAGRKLDFERWQDFADSLARSKPLRLMGH